jgi:hypothetical protein
MDYIIASELDPQIVFFHFSITMLGENLSALLTAAIENSSLRDSFSIKKG